MSGSGRHRRRDALGLEPLNLRPGTPYLPVVERQGAGARHLRRFGRRSVTAAAVASAALLVGAVVVAVGPDGSLPSSAMTSAVTSAAATPAPASAPVRATVLTVPALGLHTDLVDLGLDASGALEPPDSPQEAGWFTGGPVPGDIGPAVIAGHVDSKAGPGIFFRLRDLTPGAEVTVGRSDGGVVRYRVVGVQTVDKDAFPTEEVYGPTPAPELRLITCGGQFDHSAGRYLRNVVVSAVLVDPV